MKKFVFLLINVFSKIYTLESSHKINSIIDSLYSTWIKNFLNKSYLSSTILRHTKIVGANYISLGDGSRIWSHCVIEAIPKYRDQSFNPKIVIGDNCSIGEYSHITCTNEIIIGNGVLTGRRVLLSDNSHGVFSKEDLILPPIERKVVSKGTMIIEDNVWIGEGASVIGNVIIGKGSIVAANAVVTKDVPPYSLVAGVPATIVKKIDVDL